MPGINKYKKFSDEEILPLLQRGDERAFNEVYNRYGKRMYGFFFKMLGNNTEVANDMCQELFMKLIEKSKLYDSGQKFATWFFTLARNMCKNEYRRKERLQKNHQAWESSSQRVHDAEELSFTNSIDKLIIGQHLNVALQALDFQGRLCFVLRYQEELSVKEIAAIVDCPVGTVKSRLFYSLKKLATHLETFRSQIKQ